MADDQKPIVVGYAMKPEREKGFLKRNALPAQPIQGICFKKIDLSAPLGPQLAEVDLVLHRMMDELQSVDWDQEEKQAEPQAAPANNLAPVHDLGPRETDGAPYKKQSETANIAEQVSCSQRGSERPAHEAGNLSGPGVSGRSDGVASTHRTKRCFQMSAGHLELERFCASHPELLVVDSFDDVRVVMDRFAIHDAISNITLPGLAVTVRAPKAIRVLEHDVAKLSESMAELGMAFPCIMKPRVACGTPESHAMALLLRPEGLLESRVTLPASLQEYVDHGGLQHKVYVLGSKLFHTPRVSMPDAREILDEHREAAVVTFDSLRTPLTRSANPTADSDGATCEPTQSNGVDEAALEGIASWLREKLGLSLFGFDVVVQLDSRDHIVVDVNYFPSFKDVPKEIAVTSLWDALRHKHEQWCLLNQEDGDVKADYEDGSFC
ncbi:inositol 1,3,4-trisphosphate 5/6-kinase [Klebsormidium nitens]|uniref:inositol-1,3,4-trisphosphate 5/6-kinase n=1 Tax=Klebsormidium nitens TaxID=105231 RepID=A0A1Y1HRS6_KLENI|nr:inositol 1,3,4-trisphosphate 5/6-kinase [Klebsormidium nitens]|eukprot:GAQ79267.1 inositol 1,3,4-trisphosphate 5/6-kinase [Klebsormidium nitens]